MKALKKCLIFRNSVLLVSDLKFNFFLKKNIEFQTNKKAENLRFSAFFLLKDFFSDLGLNNRIFFSEQLNIRLFLLGLNKCAGIILITKKPEKLLFLRSPYYLIDVNR